MEGPGILHTSAGTYLFPEKKWLSKSSITPGSVLAVATMACGIKGWLIVEESLGITCSGTLGIITSHEDYVFAAGKKSALKIKVTSTHDCRNLLLAKNIPADLTEHGIRLEDIVTCEGTECSLTLGGKTCRFSNPLLEFPGYQSSLMLAAAAAMLLGIATDPLSQFTAVPGRMSVYYNQGVLVVDNANSGTTLSSTLEAARYARTISGKDAITLVIGKVEGEGAVCEGFAFEHIRAAIEQIHPLHVVWVGAFPLAGTPESESLASLVSAFTDTLAEAYTSALQITEYGSIVLAVKTWR
jgi:UDP-N-acetylmuramyl pentapeptide synthase